MDNDQLPSPWIREEPLIGDASARRYSRLTDRHGNSAILVRYPRDVAAQIERDLETRSWCERHGLRVPALVSHPPASPWAVLEDFGPADAEVSLRSAASADRLPLLVRLIEPIFALAKVSPSDLPPWNPPLDTTRLRWELAGFELWFLRHRHGICPSAEISGWLDGLASSIARHPRRVCHRDFHLNNLFVLHDGGVGVIDFQDILVGPDTYDIVSVLYERSLPELLDEADRATAMERWARWTAAEEGWGLRAHQVRVQRALKVLGSFARFEAAGASSYVPWLINLARTVAPELETVGAPPDLTDLLLDC